MKGLILCAGEGTRLRPITFSFAKPLVPVVNKPVIFYAIEKLVEAGIREIGLVIGPNGGEIREKVGDGGRWGISINYIVQERALGLAHAVKVSEEFIGDDSFLMFLGDNLIKASLKGFVKMFEEHRYDALVLLTPVEDPRAFGVAEMEGDRILSVVEKPKEPKSNLAIIGVYIFSNRVFEVISGLKPSWRGELEITDAIQALIDRNAKVKGYIVKGWWKDTGKPEDLLEANRFILEGMDSDVQGDVDEESGIIGKVVIEKGAVVRHSTVLGPAFIGEGSVIRDAFIGPFTSVGDNVSIENSEIDYSVIMSGTKIRDIVGRISASIVGRDVQILRSGQKPRVLEFIIGDKSKVRLE